MKTHFYVEMDSLKEIEAALGMARDKSKLVLKAAINDTAKQTEKGMVEETNEKYHFKGKGAIRKSNSIKKAKTSTLMATIEAAGRASNLLDLHVLPRKYYPGGRGAPRQVKANVLRGTSPKRMALYNNSAKDLYKAFVVKFKNGHLALVERVPGKKMKEKPWKQAIRALYSLSVPKAEEVVYKEVLEEDVHDLLLKNIQEQIKRFVK